MSREVERNRVLVGDALLRLQALQTNSVDCVVTSPPYFNLRRYGGGNLELGQEDQIEQWVFGLQRVLHEVARVLKPAGTLWLNVGDSFSRSRKYGAAPKSLLLGPERLLLALSSDGWIVRNKIVWNKTNPLPSSVRDRLSVTWEPVFVLTRSSRYWFDLDAVRIPHRSPAKPRGVRQRVGGPPEWAGKLASGNQSGLDSLKRQGMAGHPLGKNPGDVWTLAGSNYRGAHFATFPEQLIELPLQAGCPRWTCAKCGMAWTGQSTGDDVPSCECHAGRRHGLVLDPFFGAGTVGVVAERLGRDWLGIELNPRFAELAEQRIAAARDGASQQVTKGGEHAGETTTRGAGTAVPGRLQRRTRSVGAARCQRKLAGRVQEQLPGELAGHLGLRGGPGTRSGAT